MPLARTEPSAPPSPDDEPSAGGHRSGAVARMLGMPVATLRVWERRYGISQARLSASGQRLYSTDEVQRLALVKQLIDQGHAIGSLAALDMAQLQHVAATHADIRAATQTADHPSARTAPAGRAWRLVLLGPALGARLQRPALLRRIGRPLELLGPYDDAAQAAAAVGDAPVDAVLVHAPALHDGWLAALHAAAPAWAGLPMAVLYGFAPDAVCEALASAGTALLREPQPDAVLAQWLRGLAGPVPPATPLAVRVPAAATPPRRWDDAALADFAARSSTVACECPRHVAELLVQLSHFEAYSAACGHRHAADAALHRALQQVAAASRARFEEALEQLALHEGLLLPASAPRSSPAAASTPGRRKALPAARPPRGR